MADRFFSIEEDGLSQKWWGRVWLNPPYGKTGSTSVAGLWTKKLVESYKAGDVSEAVLLVFARIGSKWFHQLFEFAICFPDERIRFYSFDDRKQRPPLGNALAYLGPNIEGFHKQFEQFGDFGGAQPQSTPKTPLPDRSGAHRSPSAIPTPTPKTASQTEQADSSPPRALPTGFPLLVRVEVKRSLWEQWREQTAFDRGVTYLIGQWHKLRTLLRDRTIDEDTPHHLADAMCVLRALLGEQATHRESWDRAQAELLNLGYHVVLKLNAAQ